MNEIWNRIKKKRIITWKEKRPQRNSWFDEECQVKIEDKKRAYNEMINRNTRQNKQEYKDEKKKHVKYLYKTRGYCWNQSWSKWK